MAQPGSIVSSLQTPPLGTVDGWMTVDDDDYDMMVG